MKLVTSFENPPIPWRKFDWVCFDEDQMSEICEDPDCNCRQNLVRGWGATEELAILAFVSDLLIKHDISLETIGLSENERAIERMKNGHWNLYGRS